MPRRHILSARQRSALLDLPTDEAALTMNEAERPRLPPPFCNFDKGITPLRA